jgi:hypothetical protein
MTGNIKTGRHSRHLSTAASTFSTLGVIHDSPTPEISVLYDRFAGQRTMARTVLWLKDRNDMFRISTVDTPHERRLVVEGTLVNPWVAELRSTWGTAGDYLEGRRLVIDLTNATMIDSQGEAAIFELMQDGATFCCSGVLTKHVLKQLARKCHTGQHNVLNRKRARSEE